MRACARARACVCVLQDLVSPAPYLTHMPFYYPHAFFKKRRGYCNRLRPSVRPLCYLLLNYWTKFNQIWCVSNVHKWGVQRQTFFCPAPWGPGEGSKGQISFNFNYKVNFKDFYTKLVCVFSQMKDTKHIRWDIHSVP